MDFRDKDGAPLIKWTDPEGAFEAWKECSRGPPCDYSGLTYAKLAGGSGIQWPCNDEHPDGTERLYTDGRFPTDADVCGDFGHDLITGAAIEPEEYRAHDPDGRAFLKAGRLPAAAEEPDADYPFWLTTGRVVYHFHTRTKTGRSQALERRGARRLRPDRRGRRRAGSASPRATWSRSSRAAGGSSAPGADRRHHPGHLFVPFHYGYWDEHGRPARPTS